MGNIQEELREKWKSGMKEALYNAVVKVMAADGLQGLTMDRITQEAGIGKGTIYNYFEDKKDLLRYVVSNSFEPLFAENERILSSAKPPSQKLQDYVYNTLSYFDKHRSFFRVLLDTELSRPRLDSEGRERLRKITSLISGVISEGINGGAFRPAPPVKLAEMLFFSCVSVTRGRLWREDYSPIEEDARLVIDVFFKGITKVGEEK